MNLYGNYYDRMTSKAAFKNKHEALMKNKIDYALEMDLARNLFINRFLWQTPNFPNISQYYIERCILLYGAVGIFMHDEFGLMVLPALPQKRNVYGEVQSWRVFKFNANMAGVESLEPNDFFAEVPAELIAIISDNPDYSQPIRMIRRYAERTADMNRTEEVYARGLKSPNVFFVNSEKQETSGLIQQQMDDNKAMITLDEKLLDKQGTLPIALQTGRTASELITLMKATNYKFSQLLARLGVCAVEELKGANMTEDEVYQNGELSRRVFACAKQCREIGIEDARAKFGCDLSFKELQVVNPGLADERMQPQQFAEEKAKAKAKKGKSNEK